MALKIHIVDDYDAMTDFATDFLYAQYMQREEGTVFNIGGATGNTPSNMWRELFAREGIDPSSVRMRFLDEYIGLPGSTLELRAAHPESYNHYVSDHIAAHYPGMDIALPPGVHIDGPRLQDICEKLDIRHGSVIDPKKINDSYVQEIYEKLLEPYAEKIKANGKMDWWVVSSGEEGHIGFHEQGIPFGVPDVMAVYLAQNTIDNAVLDGHFSSQDCVPHLAATVSAPGVYNLSENILVMLSGRRKVHPTEDSLLNEPSPDCPLSIVQQFHQDGAGNVVYIVDREAAQLIFRRQQELIDRGYTIQVH